MKCAGIFVNNSSEEKYTKSTYYFLEKICKICDSVFFLYSFNKIDYEFENYLDNKDIKFIHLEYTDNFDGGIYFIKKYYSLLSSFDSIILFNGSFFGPFSSLESILAKANNSKVFSCLSFKSSEPGLNSFDDFVCLSFDILFINSNFLSSNIFRDYLNSLTIKKENSTRNLLEFSHFLCSNHILCSSLVHHDSLVSYKSSLDLLFYYCKTFVSNIDFPVVPKEAFSDDSFYWDNFGEGFLPNDVLTKIKPSPYPFKFIIEEILQKEPLSCVKRALSLNEVFSENNLIFKTSKKICLICYAYYSDLVDEIFPYIRNLPSFVDVFIISSQIETLNSYKKSVCWKAFLIKLSISKSLTEEEI